MSTPQTWLTQEAADRLRSELETLETTGRRDVTAKIEAARAEGDLKENGGYHAARDEQGKMEARIRQLKQILENAHIGTPPASADGVVGQIDDTIPAGERFSQQVAAIPTRSAPFTASIARCRAE